MLHTPSQNETRRERSFDLVNEASLVPDVCSQAANPSAHQSPTSEKSFSIPPFHQLNVASFDWE